METKINVGQSAELSKTFTESDVFLFSELSRDINPIHLDEDYARNSMFKNRIVHGFLYSSLISALIANKLPGEGSIYKYQTLKFLMPVYYSELVTARVTVREIIEEKSIVYLDTILFKNGNENEIVVKGEAIIKKLK